MQNIYIAQFVTVIIVHFLAVVSPGPDFIIVTKNSLSSGRKNGILTALGVALGIGVHVTYCLLGVGLIISKSIIVFNFIKWIGALYLIYIGLKGLRARKKNIEEIKKITEDTGFNTQSIKTINAFRMGFIVNVFNPKATLFFLALFTQIINPNIPTFIQIGFGLWMIFATFVWFSIVAIAFSNERMKTKIQSIEHWIDRISGAILIALGIKVISNK